jgi:hypothetical protein
MATINPLQAPINYAVEVQNPFEAAIGGFKLGAGVAEAQAAQQARTLALEQQTKFQTGINDFFKKPVEDRKYSDFDAILPYANKDQFTALQAITGNMTKERLDASKTFTTQALLALQNNPPKAAQIIQERIDIEKDPNQKRGLESILAMTYLDPKKSSEMLEFTGLAAFGEDWYKGLTTFRKGPSEVSSAVSKADKDLSDAIIAREKAKNAPEVEAADADIKKLQAEQERVKAKFQTQTILADLDSKKWTTQNLKSQVGERDFLLQGKKELQDFQIAEIIQKIAKSAAPDISEGAKKEINALVMSSVDLRNSATSALNLANKIQTEGGGLGKITSFAQAINTATGQQDGFTQLRNEYNRLRNSVAIKNLPPGVATDKDISLALEGLPPPTANADFIASFLRGTAKLQQYEAATKDAQTEWISSVGSLGNTRNDIQIGNTRVPKGTTYVEFQDRFMKRNADELSKQQAIDAIPTRGYMNYGKPQ